MADEEAAPRTWHMYANDDGDGRLAELGEHWWVEMHGLGLPIVPVRVTEVAGDDPVATHWGWLWQGKTVPEMIWGSKAAYRTQFTYGPKAEEERGRGRTLRLAVTRLGEGDEVPLWGFLAAAGDVLPQTVLCVRCECKRPQVKAAREAAQASADWDQEPSRTDCTDMPGLACGACGYRPAATPGT